MRRAVRWCPARSSCFTSEDNAAQSHKLTGQSPRPIPEGSSQDWTLTSASRLWLVSSSGRLFLLWKIESICLHCEKPWQLDLCLWPFVRGGLLSLSQVEKQDDDPEMMNWGPQQASPPPFLFCCSRYPKRDRCPGTHLILELKSLMF